METSTQEDKVAINQFIFHIDNDWSATHFTHLFDAFNRLYSYHNLLISYARTHESFARELNYHKSINNLPDMINLRDNLVIHAKAILSESDFISIIEEGDIFYLRYGHLRDLHVKKLQFGSKGSVDFIGIGKVFSSISELIKHYIPNKEKKLNMVLMEKEIEEREQKILQMKIDNLKRMGVEHHDIISLIGLESVHAKKIIKLHRSSQITEFEIRNSEN